MIKNIIIIEDEKEIINSLSFLLEKNGFKVSAYLSAEDFFSVKNKPNKCVYLVDWNLPGIKGTDVIRTLRLKDQISPVFMMTSYSTQEQIITGLKCGADDYITKPFDYNELIVRLNNAYLKLKFLEDNLTNIGLKWIPEANTVIRDGIHVGLTKREFTILYYLHKHQQAISREELIKQFDNDAKMTKRNIDVHIFSLRKKIEKIKIKVETVWAAGYKISL